MITWWKRYRQVRAFKALFLYPDGDLKPEARIVIECLRDEVNAKGRRVNANGNSLLFNAHGFDASAVAYSAGQRRVFDFIVSNLSLDEREVFNLASAMDDQQRQAELANDLTTI